MEGRFWQCRWEQDRRGYRVWVSRRPRIVARGRTWREALDGICAKIESASGDGEPVLSFDPPEPLEGGDAAFAHPDWLALSAEGYVPIDATGPELFTGGYCRHCGDPIGRRGRVPVRAGGAAEGDLCSPGLMFNRFVPLICTERFVGALTPKEKGAFRWLPVVPAPRTKKKLFECVPRRFVAPVAIRGGCVEGSRCPACGRRSFLCTTEPEVEFSRGQIHEWVACGDLPRRVDGAVAVGSWAGWALVFPAGRARELARRFRGVRTCRLGLVPAGREVREPKLPKQRGLSFEPGG